MMKTEDIYSFLRAKIKEKEGRKEKSFLPFFLALDNKFYKTLRFANYYQYKTSFEKFCMMMNSQVNKQQKKIKLICFLLFK